ncbi:HlyD family efflux transporter periplasmic adaptor subunit [Desulfocurvus sp. DL9XJH121]
MLKKILIAAVAAAVAAGLYWGLAGNGEGPSPLALYGNVDLRQVDLAFRETERLASVDVEEGDVVEAGRVVARQDTSLLDRQIAQAEAALEADRAALRRLTTGNRPQEIAQAAAQVESARAELKNAQRILKRRKELLAGGFVAQEQVDDALAARDVAQARFNLARENLDLLREGARQEDVDKARAAVAAREADLDYLRQRLAQAELRAPAAGVVQSRMLEPGDMASASRPVCTLALTDPKWVRAYVSETDLGRVKPGMAMEVRVDSFPDRAFQGWVGYISPMAEFTPRNVETPELRTYLVYEVRVQVKDPGGLLRLGSPATVSPAAAAPANPGAAQ